MDKNKNLLIVVTAIACVILAGFFLRRIESSSDERSNNSLAKVRNGVKNKNQMENEELPIKSPQSRPNVRVEVDGRTVTAVERDGNIRWSVDVIAECGEPLVGAPVIRDIKLDEGKVNVVFGKHSFASVDIETGKVSYLGAD